MISDEIKNITTEIDSSTNLDPYIQNIDIIENNSGKFIQLINSNDDEFQYALNNKYYIFQFKEPIYVQKIIFTPIDDIKLKGLELISIDINGNEASTSFGSTHTIWSPNKVITGFKFKPPKKLFKKITLNKLEIVGFTLNDFITIKDKVKEISEYKSTLTQLAKELESKDIDLDEKVSSIETTIEKQESLIATLIDEQTDLEDSALPPLREEASRLTDDITELSTKKDLLEKEQTNLTNNITQLETTSSELNKEISIKDSELKKLVSNTNIFSTEIEEYITQGNQDIKLYSFLSLIPWILIMLVTYTVFFGSSNLSTELISMIKEGSKIDIMTVFWLRLPFVIIVVSILFVSYEISKMFIKNIIHIQKQRRTFAKIGIIAKDIADSSIEGLNIKEKEKFELRTKLKMDLLKSHLTNEIGEKYEYNINTSLWETFKTHLINKSKITRKKRVPTNTSKETVVSDTTDNT